MSLLQQSVHRRVHVPCVLLPMFMEFAQLQESQLDLSERGWFASHCNVKMLLTGCAQTNSRRGMNVLRQFKICNVTRLTSGCA
eukprot:1157198-Pelagomonas_calceolata.AAC.2